MSRRRRRFTILDIFAIVLLLCLVWWGLSALSHHHSSPTSPSNSSGVLQHTDPLPVAQLTTLEVRSPEFGFHADFPSRPDVLDIDERDKHVMNGLGEGAPAQEGWRYSQVLTLSGDDQHYCSTGPLQKGCDNGVLQEYDVVVFRANPTSLANLGKVEQTAGATATTIDGVAAMASNSLAGALPTSFSQYSVYVVHGSYIYWVFGMGRPGKTFVDSFHFASY